MAVDLDRLIELMGSDDENAVVEFARALVRAGQMTVTVPEPEKPKIPVLVWDSLVLDVIADIPPGTPVVSEYEAHSSRQANVRVPNYWQDLRRFFWDNSDFDNMLVTVNGLACVHSDQLWLDEERLMWVLDATLVQELQFTKQLTAGDQIVFRTARIEMEESTT